MELYAEIQELRSQLKGLTVEGRTLVDLGKKEERKLNDEEEKRFLEVEAQITEKRSLLESKEREYRLLTVEKEVAGYTDPTSPAQRAQPRTEVDTRSTGTTPSSSSITTAANAEEFRSIGEFLECARFAPTSERMQEHARRTQTVNVGSEGGLLVPKKISTDLMMLTVEKSIVEARASVDYGDASMPDQEVEYPAIKQGAEGEFGGFDVRFEGEGEAGPETGVEIEGMCLKPLEMKATVSITNKLLRNASALTSYINDIGAKAMAAKRDWMYLNGSGVKQPLGVLKAPGAIWINRDTAGTIVYEDLLKLEAAQLSDSALLMSARRSSYNVLKDIMDADDNRVYRDTQLINGQPVSLNGSEYIRSGRMPILGVSGDLAMIDWSQYKILIGLGLKIDMSEHVDFKTNKTVIRFIMSVDGQPKITEPMTLENGEEVSPYTLLK